MARLVYLLLSIASVAAGSRFTEEYNACQKNGGYGVSNLVCDPTGRLADSTRTKLTNLLKSLEKKVKCPCEDGCKRLDGSDGYVGLIHVSDSNATSDLEADMMSEYKAAGLGNATCDHGLVLVYMKDSQQLATFRGGNSFVLLTDEDMGKLHEMAQRGSTPDREGDTLALQYLLHNYKDIAEHPIQRAEGWIPVLGLVAAVLLALLIMAILLAVFAARFCCCCVKNKKDEYTVTTLPSYKTIEPLYVVTPPASERTTRHPGETAASDRHQIYSTPYSGSPLPMLPPPIGTSTTITPSSTYRRHIAPIEPAYGTLGSTLYAKRVPRRAMSDVGGPHVVGPIPHPAGRALSTGYGSEHDLYMSPPEGIYGTSPSIAGSHIYGTVPRRQPSIVAMDPNLHWLDPERKQETQTREELIGGEEEEKEEKEEERK